MVTPWKKNAKFSDFVKVGTALTLLMWATLSIILSLSYDL